MCARAHVTLYSIHLAARAFTHMSVTICWISNLPRIPLPSTLTLFIVPIVGLERVRSFTTAVFRHFQLYSLFLVSFKIHFVLEKNEVSFTISGIIIKYYKQYTTLQYNILQSVQFIVYTRDGNGPGRPRAGPGLKIQVRGPYGPKRA